MNAVVTVARFSLLEHFRRRLIAFFGVGSLVLTAGLLYVATRHEARAVIAEVDSLAVLASLGFVPFFTLLAALAVSMNNIGSPFSTGEAVLILARPITRVQYALGRLAASVGVAVALCVLLAVELQIVAVTEGRGLISELWLHWATSAFGLTVVAAMTTLFSALVSTPALAAILGFVMHQAVGPIEAAHFLVRRDLVHGSLARVIELLWYISPKHFRSPLIDRLTRETADAVTGWNTPVRSVWAVAYLAFVVALLVVAVRRKEV